MEIQGLPLALGPNAPDDGDAGRQMRGAMIAGLVTIKKTPIGYKVPSQSGAGSYVVNVDGDEPFCSCPDFELRQRPCKHIYSVEFLIRRDEGQDGAVQETKAMRVTYSQDWPAYNAAQTNEGDHFLVLLRELCDTIEEPPYDGSGRPRLLLSDMVYAMGLKVYSQLSGRRATSFIRDAYKKGFLAKTPHFNTVLRYMEDPEITDLLRGLIQQSALPLVSVEQDFAVDSSGFSTVYYHRWFNHKWGREIKESKWIKTHICTGVKTNIITDAVATEKIGHDTPYLKPFIENTAKHFVIREVSGDKAYLSKGNLRAVEALGGMAFIPFKKNSVAKTANHKRDALWSQMFYYFNYCRDEFLSHYHKRSNVETTFSMIKAKFGSDVKGKNESAQCNEVMVKILVHNIVVLIHEMYALGIAVNFLDVEPVVPSETQTYPPKQSVMGL